MPSPISKAKDELDSNLTNSEELKDVLNLGEEVRYEVEPKDFAEMSDFGRATHFLMESYAAGRGRVLDGNQVKALAEGLLEMADTIQAGVAYTEQVEEELSELKEKRGLWRLKK